MGEGTLIRVDFELSAGVAAQGYERTAAHAQKTAER